MYSCLQILCLDELQASLQFFCSWPWTNNKKLMLQIIGVMGDPSVEQLISEDPYGALAS